jgi:hypothetical protein
MRCQDLELVIAAGKVRPGIENHNRLSESTRFNHTRFYAKPPGLDGNICNVISQRLNVDFDPGFRSRLQML